MEDGRSVSLCMVCDFNDSKQTLHLQDGAAWIVDRKLYVKINLERSGRCATRLVEGSLHANCEDREKAVEAQNHVQGSLEIDITVT